MYKNLIIIKWIIITKIRWHGLINSSAQVTHTIGKINSKIMNAVARQSFPMLLDPAGSRLYFILSMNTIRSCHIIIIILL